MSENLYILNKSTLLDGNVDMLIEYILILTPKIGPNSIFKTTVFQ